MYIQNAVAEGLEECVQEAQGRVLLQQAHHQVDVQEGVPSPLLHAGQVAAQSQLIHNPAHTTFI